MSKAKFIKPDTPISPDSPIHSIAPSSRSSSIIGSSTRSSTTDSESEALDSPLLDSSQAVNEDKQLGRKERLNRAADYSSDSTSEGGYSTGPQLSEEEAGGHSEADQSTSEGEEDSDSSQSNEENSSEDSDISATRDPLARKDKSNIRRGVEIERHSSKTERASTTPTETPPNSAKTLELEKKNKKKTRSTSRKRPRAKGEARDKRDLPVEESGIEADDNIEEEGDNVEREEGISLSAKKGAIIPLVPVRPRTPRTWKHDMARLISLYVVPLLLSVPISLLLSLNVQLLTPLYNSIPLALHTESLHVACALLPAIAFWYITLRSSAKEVISFRVCFSLAALSGDLVAVFGRKVGSMMGNLLGPEWGAFGARAILGVGIISGGLSFALLCFDHISPILPATKPTDRPRNLGSILYRSTFYVFHIYFFERMWTRYLSIEVSILNRNPEKTILFVSLLLTAISLFLRPGTSSTPFPTRAQSIIDRSFGLTPQASKGVSNFTSFLPSHAFPLLLLLRIPLLILALRQQVFLRPPTSNPYITANGELRVISSVRSITGQIVVAENLKDGYRFLRCDHSILGGRWIREVTDDSIKGGIRTNMGDSIFATFNLQEIAVLAHRSDPSESLIRTLQLTTDLEVDLDGELDQEEDKEPERALIIGLGAGIAASTFSKRGMYVDIAEIDPVVYMAAHEHFLLSAHSIASTNIIDGSSFISQLADLKRENNETEESLVPMWDYVIQDCFTGGTVPGELFTYQFWQDLGEVTKVDGIIAMNFAGILKSKASKAVLVTLLSVFPQCRAFGDGFEADQGPNDLVNMVVFCTKTYSPLLTFRAPTPFDGLRSPLRAHVYSTFHPHEIRLDTIVSDEDMVDPELMLVKGRAKKELNKWQIGSSMATWRAMQKILTPEMWLAY
ncbi:uncharacterized protein IL334_003376 [Kwoniella shivajii]|uniref:Spermine/spermidine synthase n=1 Tax=Kwoniella shivajii TaxID=564305 RepID=A0ABZ1CXP6_9TREE|nr:hypothetical protein IL334_003376 [Kwoniella shivajii]